MLLSDYYVSPIVSTSNKFSLLEENNKKSCKLSKDTSVSTEGLSFNELYNSLKKDNGGKL